MNVLKQIVEKQKKEVSEWKSKCQTPWIPRCEVEREEKRRRLAIAEEERKKREQQEALRLATLNEYLSKPKGNIPLDHGEDKGFSLYDDDQPEKGYFESIHADEACPDEPPPLGKEEVIKRLRRRSQVVTFFGETDRQRYKRLYQLELAEHDDDFMGGQKNVFLELLEQDKTKNRKTGFSIKKPECHSDDENEVDNLLEARKTCRTSSIKPRGTSSTSGYGSQSTKAGTGDSTLVSQPETKETRIIRWISEMLELWGKELEERTEEEKTSNVGKVSTAQYRQTEKDLKPLIKKLKRCEMDSDILDKIYDMVVFCEAKNYKRTHDKYIELSIGNAAWPMGVTMVGIHERAGRSKIFTSEIAHILNDETTRKYIHMLKRLISFAQRYFPTDPSTMVTLSSTHV